MGEILFLAHRIPFPPDRGDKIRSHHILKRLAEIAPVHVATFGETEHDLAQESALAEVAASYCLAKRSKPLAIAGLEALTRNLPVSLTAFRSSQIEEFVARTIATRPISAIYVFSGQMGQYLPFDYPGRIIADFVDVDSAKFEAYADRKSGPRGWIDAREARVLHAEEVRLARKANVSLLISDVEAALFRDRLPDRFRAAVAVRTLGNGIDSGAFDPDAASPASELLACTGPRIIFTGQMDYEPNIDAVHRAIERIMPAVRMQCPDATFHVVGRNPPADLLSRHGQEGNFVWGSVPDMRDWLKGADIALVPLDIARGVQNKVLEAMSMALPVVLTPDAATGITAQDGRDFLIERDDAQLAEAIVALARDPGQARNIGQSAREFVVENASWDAALASLPEIVAAGGRNVRNAA